MPRPPNVVVFFTDQQRWDCSSLHGNPLELMPNFDRVARRATHVAHSFTCAPVCGPARACLQTGTHITTHGAIRNDIGLTPDLPNLAGCFHDAGYHTGYIGKWHLAGRDGLTTAGARGAVRAGHRGNYRQWLAVEALEFSVHEYHTVLYDDDDQPVRLPGYRSDALVDASIRFIHQHRDRPFFLMTSFIEPHHQNDKDDYPPPEGYRERYAGRWTPPDLAALPAHGFDDGDPNGRQVGGSTQQHLGGYYGMVKRLDEGFGRILDALRSLDLERDTVVLFTSDHACHFKTRNAEYKRSCHDSSIRVPTLLAGPGFEGGGQLQQLVSLVDLPPTLLDACGIAPPPTMEGRSLLPLLRGGAADWPQEVLVQVCDAKVGRAVRTRRWKYCVMSETDSRKIQSRDDWSRVEYREAFLYDLHHDPYELVNLIDRGSHGQVKRVMRERLLRRMAALGEPTPTIALAEDRPSGQRRVRDDEVLQ